MNMQLRQEYPVEAGDFVRAGDIFHGNVLL